VADVDVLVVVFPGQLAGPRATEAVSVARGSGAAPVRDVIFLIRTTEGVLRVIEFRNDSDGSTFGPLVVASVADATREDELLVGAGVPANSTAAVVTVDSGGWGRAATQAVRRLGGDITIHRRVPEQVIIDCLRTGGTMLT
jgi:hypothetical protein